MSEFKVGDEIWFVDRPYDDIRWYTVSAKMTIMQCNSLRTNNAFHTRREALAEAIRQNEGLASELAMEIARLKEELESCKK